MNKYYYMYRYCVRFSESPGSSLHLLSIIQDSVFGMQKITFGSPVHLCTRCYSYISYVSYTRITRITRSASLMYSKPVCFIRYKSKYLRYASLFLSIIQDYYSGLGSGSRKLLLARLFILICVRDATRTSLV